ncbi:MAG: class I SAM-dependent methyltransferase [Acetobacteraceae bacterium]|nr:class I SAM-dependent methyltransferase [Acetobacteraceae bacterium]
MEARFAGCGRATTGMPLSVMVHRGRHHQSGPDPQDDIRAVFARVAARYGVCGRTAQAYVASKLRRDPVHRAVLALARPLGLGEVLDAGCGRGQMGIALLEAGLARAVLGLDCAAARLAETRRAAMGLSFGVAAQDLASDRALPGADTVLMIDVLYQLAPAVQRQVIASAARGARRAVLIRTLDPDRGWRSALTVGFERLTRHLSPHAGRYVAPLPVAEIAQMFRSEGFAVDVTPCWGGTPFSNVLLSATRLA